ncbi:MAG: hypothetical protein IJC89_00050 [Clostridia bacterium]|nr:hypothetical protein [Clostridia bacterium]
MKKKGLKITLLVILIIAIISIVVGKFAVDYIFNKVYLKVTENRIEEEINLENTKTDKKNTIVAEDGIEYTISDENSLSDNTIEIKGKDGKKYLVIETSGKTPESEEGSKSDKAIKQLKDLTAKELQEIQAMITVTDKLGALNIVRAALTVEEKREIKKMVADGKINYSRVQAILSARLSGAQKAKLYAYYDKYINLYFNGE